MEHFVRKKNLIRIAISFLIILSLVFLYIFFYPLPWGISKKSTSIIVEKGDNLRKISQKLKSSGLGINSTLLFVSSKLSGIDRKIIPGRYDFQKGVTLSGLLQKFYKNETSSIDITIPEGYNLYQIASLLKKEVGLDSLVFVKTAFDTSLIHRLGLNSKNLEGYLFPDTYKLFWMMEPEKIAEMMVQEFKKLIDATLPLELRNSNFNLSEIVTLASLVESEAKIDNERPLISAVYHNRLKIGMPLQCDPTVIYALGGLSRPLNHKDLEVDSPYNTYKHPGLPPGPINNPGKASILAALFPAEVNYLYFVAKGDGSHIFSVDLEEHNRAIAKIKRENKS
ncbi:MAG: endolytic transglycosylase MltG [candidate division Zixibacteria bacterium]|nr:endolytic transglycosylase MltG [candidate division Zixibacteria bacterium]